MYYKYTNDDFQPESRLIASQLGWWARTRTSTKRTPFPSDEDVGWELLTEGGEDYEAGTVKRVPHKVCR